MAEEHVDYKRAAKTTFLFSAVQIIRLGIGLIRNKVVAVLLGPAGMGIMNVLTSYTHFVQSGACLGLSQSAVKDVSEANGENNREKFSRIISLTNKLVLMTSLLGLVITAIMSPYFSKWGFGHYGYTISFILLSLSVAFEIYVENRLAILKGMRQMRSLAKTTIIGSIAGLITGIPIFFFMGEKGIVPSILVSSFTGVIVTNYFVNKISYDKIDLSFKEIINEGGPMLKMGIALMSINFLSSVFVTIITTYLSRRSGVEMVGIYRSGEFLLKQCFGVVLVAMNTDYYPRICAVNNNNIQLKAEVNAQSKLGLTLCLPLALAFVAYSTIIITLLYSNAFLDIITYTDIAIIGTLVSVPSNCIAMVLLAKQDAKAFTSIAVVLNIVNLGVFIGMYEWLGLLGLGFANIINCLMQIVVYCVVINKRHGIRLSKEVLLLTLVSIFFVIIAVAMKSIFSTTVLYVVESVLVIVSCIYSYIKLKKMNINVFAFIKKKVEKK